MLLRPRKRHQIGPISVQLGPAPDSLGPQALKGFRILSPSRDKHLKARLGGLHAVDSEGLEHGNNAVPMCVNHECKRDDKALATQTAAAMVAQSSTAEDRQKRTWSNAIVLAVAIRLTMALMRSGSTGNTASPAFRRRWIMRSPITSPPDSVSPGLRSRATMVKTFASPVCPWPSDHERS